jgi:hypothetical protein
VEKRIASLDAVLLSVLVLARIDLSAFTDYILPKPWEFIREIPLLGSLLPADSARVLADPSFNPLSLLLVAFVLFLLFVYLLIDVVWGGEESYRIKLGIIFLIILFTVIANGFFTLMTRHYGAVGWYAHDGGVPHTEEATKYFIAGKNPYLENYFNTSLEMQLAEEHPAFYHYPYLPFTFIFSSAFYVLSQATIGWYDQRFVYIPLFLLTLSLLPRFTLSKVGKLCLVIIVGLNPIMSSDVIFGANDPFVLFWIVLSLWLLLSERETLSAAALGLACATKLTAWPLVPFYLLYFCREPSLSWDTIKCCFKRSIPLLLTVLAFVLPFLLWCPNAMLDDILGYTLGTSQTSYPIAGWGFSNFILALGWAATKDSHFPVWIFMVIIGLPVMLYLLSRQARENTFHSMIIGYGLTLLALFYFSRYLNANFLAYAIALFTLGYFCDQ